ncbi:uncharacterized protein ACH125_007325 [Urocitellus parryii]
MPASTRRLRCHPQIRQMLFSFCRFKTSRHLHWTSGAASVSCDSPWTGKQRVFHFGGPTKIPFPPVQIPARGPPGVTGRINMGQSITTPLSLTLDHWQDVRNRANNLSVEVKKKKWITLCTAEWPTLNVGWRKEGTFNPDLILQVKSQVFIQGSQGHPDQVPYIVTWENLASDPPLWVAPFSPPKPALRTPSEAPPPPSAPLIPIPAPPPYQPQPVPAPDSIQVSSEEEEEQVDPVTNNPPGPSPMVGRLRGRREPTASGDTSRVPPLRHTGGPNGQYQYWPFSASDLYNWKTHNPSFSSDPVALTSLIESILVTHQPTWDDCQQLLQTLLTSEEKQKVLLEARKKVPGDDGRPTQLPNLINEAFPLTQPDWDYNTDAGRNHLRLYRQLLIAGLHGAGRRPTNLAQVRQTTQGPEETPTAFLERLKEAYRRYTPFDPDNRSKVQTPRGLGDNWPGGCAERQSGDPGRGCVPFCYRFRRSRRAEVAAASASRFLSAAAFPSRCPLRPQATSCSRAPAPGTRVRAGQSPRSPRVHPSAVLIGQAGSPPGGKFSVPGGS